VSQAYSEVLAALSELADLMQGVIDGDYTPDSFTLQPAHAALVKAGAFVLCDDDAETCFLPECREHGCMSASVAVIAEERTKS
jgi:hypothetical protein